MDPENRRSKELEKRASTARTVYRSVVHGEISYGQFLQEIATLSDPSNIRTPDDRREAIDYLHAFQIAAEKHGDDFDVAYVMDALRRVMNTKPGSDAEPGDGQ